MSGPVGGGFFLTHTVCAYGVGWFQVEFSIGRYHGSSGEVRVRYTIVSGTARPTPDPQALYVPQSGWLLFTSGGLGRQTVSVTLRDNGLLEGPRTFYVNITRLELIEPRLVGHLNYNRN